MVSVSKWSKYECECDGLRVSASVWSDSDSVVLGDSSIQYHSTVECFSLYRGTVISQHEEFKDDVRLSENQDSMDICSAWTRLWLLTSTHWQCGMYDSESL
jgi:hypothetical protein